MATAPKEIFQFFVIQCSRFVNKQTLYLFLLICRPRVVILIYFSKLYFDSKNLWVRYGWASVRHGCLASTSVVSLSSKIGPSMTSKRHRTSPCYPLKYRTFLMVFDMECKDETVEFLSTTTVRVLHHNISPVVAGVVVIAIYFIDVTILTNMVQREFVCSYLPLIYCNSQVLKWILESILSLYPLQCVITNGCLISW